MKGYLYNVEYEGLHRICFFLGYHVHFSRDFHDRSKDPREAQNTSTNEVVGTQAIKMNVEGAK